MSSSLMLPAMPTLGGDTAGAGGGSNLTPQQQQNLAQMIMALKQNQGGSTPGGQNQSQSVTSPFQIPGNMAMTYMAQALKNQNGQSNSPNSQSGLNYDPSGAPISSPVFGSPTLPGSGSPEDWTSGLNYADDGAAIPSPVF